MTPHVLEKDREVKEEVTWKTYDVAEYNRLSASFDHPKTMKWKLVPKPGGQAIKTDDYYTLQACIKQVEEGDAPKEQPMWTDTGAVDDDAGHGLSRSHLGSHCVSEVGVVD